MSDTGPVQLVHVIQTCIACPAQWDAWDAEYRYYYLRYRHGRGTVERAATKDAFEASWPTGSEFLTEFRTGEDHCAADELEDFLRYAGLVLSPDAKVEEMSFDDEDEQEFSLATPIGGVPLGVRVLIGLAVVQQYKKWKGKTTDEVATPAAPRGRAHQD